MRQILFIFVCPLSIPAQAMTIPGVTPPASTNTQTAPTKEPDVEQKRAAYGALADVLENDTSRKGLIDQLRKMATAPPAEPVPTVVPPTLTEKKTVLENVTDITRHYGEALSSRSAQLYHNITDTPHKTFNP